MAAAASSSSPALASLARQHGHGIAGEISEHDAEALSLLSGNARSNRGLLGQRPERLRRHITHWWPVGGTGLAWDLPAGSCLGIWEERVLPAEAGAPPASPLVLSPCRLRQGKISLLLFPQFQLHVVLLYRLPHHATSANLGDNWTDGVD